jgi:hypothetical protein
MRRSLKFVHTVATMGLVGAFVVQLIVAARTPPMAGTEVAALLGARQLMVDVAGWVLLPSTAAMLVSGLLLMGSNRSYSSAGWVWAKALLGLVLIKAVLLINHSAARDIAALVAAGIDGHPDRAAELARLVRMEWLGTWLGLAIALVATALGIWRPKSKPRARAAAPAVATGDDATDRPADAPFAPQPPARAAQTASVVALRPNTPPSTSIIDSAAACNDALPDAQASSTVMQR